MDYYQYQSNDVSDTAIHTGDTLNRSGRAINPNPVLRLLLEPRSLVITHGELYTQHLHGILGVHSDRFSRSQLVLPVTDEPLRPSDQTDAYTTQSIPAKDISNRKLLGSLLLRNQFGELESPVISEVEPNSVSFSLERDTRTSLTCRVVEKTAKAAGKLVRLK